MRVLIKGAGITGMLLCDVLKDLHPDFEISVHGKEESKKEIPLLLDLSQLDFEIDTIKKLTKRKIKVGYTNDGLKTITSEPTEEMLDRYYDKQGRTRTSSSMSNSKSEFNAIDLRNWYDLALNRCSKFMIKGKIDESQYDVIFETKNPCDLLNNVYESKEYILMENNNLKGYDYVYDCSNNDIKRYNAKCTEFLHDSVEGMIVIKNYYRSPVVLSEYDTTNKLERIYISRNTTKSQLKIVDALNYVNYRWGVKNED